MPFSIPVKEIFFSIQGEGVFVGQQTIFMRVSGCNLSCQYCDTVYQNGRDMKYEHILARINRLVPQKSKALPMIAITGGEPLLYPKPLHFLMKALRKKGFFCMLQTNGTLPDALRKILPMTDYVCMDIKCPSDCGRNYFADHRKCLAFTQGKKISVKTVITQKILQEEFKKAVRLVEEINPNIPFIIQPVTYKKQVSRAIVQRCLKCGEYARTRLADVRIIPQMHVILGVR